jgi:hypothetical protein
MDMHEELRMKVLAAGLKLCLACGSGLKWFYISQLGDTSSCV